MNEQLRQTYEEAQQLPENTQNELAARIAILLDEIREELEWDRIVSQPHVQKRLRELGQQALVENAVGETEEGGFDGK